MPLPVAVTTVIAGLGAMSLLGSLFPPLGRFSTQLQNKNWSNEILDPYVLADMRVKEFLNHDDYLAEMKKHGLNDTNANRLFESARTYLSAFDYITLFRRGKIDEQELTVFLRANKFNDDTIKRAMDVTEYFPPPQDLIRFAVREVYSDDVREKFGQDDDFPERFKEEALKGGMTEEQARNYWASHWQLPSIQMGYEMLHRRQIDDSELDVLLRALDVMPYWREKLKSISYSPYTRVDVRRMYGMGVLDQNAVYENYRDLGYDHEHATKMTEFTVKYESNDTDGLTRSSIQTAFKRGLINSTQMLEYFKDLGYSDEVANLWIEMTSYEAWLQDLDDQESNIIRAYKIGNTTIEEVSQYLYGQNLPTQFVNKLLDKLEQLDNSGRKVLSRTDLEKAYKLGTIDGKSFAERILKLGYKGDDFRIIMGINGVKEKEYTGVI